VKSTHPQCGNAQMAAALEQQLKGYTALSETFCSGKLK
jgi:hypothetical protein